VAVEDAAEHRADAEPVAPLGGIEQHADEGGVGERRCAEVALPGAGPGRVGCAFVRDEAGKVTVEVGHAGNGNVRRT
jgi:hypothetical protein